MIFSRLQSIMLEKGIKPYPLSKELGVSRTFIYSLMSSDFERISAKSLNTLCHYLGIKSLEALLVFEPVEFYIYDVNGKDTELEPVVRNVEDEEFNFFQYVHQLDEMRSNIKLRIEIEGNKYEIEVTCNIIGKDDDNYEEKNVGINFSFSDLSFAKELPIQSFMHIKAWLHTFFKYYMRRTVGKNPSYSTYPMELLNFVETDDRDLLDVVNEISEKQDQYYRSIMSHLIEKK